MNAPEDDKVFFSDGRSSFIDEAKLTPEQRKLISEIREKFKPDDIVADLCILYEVTGYQDKSPNADFWPMYMDFFELGEDENLIRQDRMEVKALPPDRQKTYREKNDL